MRAAVKLLPKTPHRVLHGHPWVFANEVESVEGTYSPGDIVEVRSARGDFLGLGYINPRSAILVRILSQEDREIDRGFFRDRLEQAIELRRSAFGTRDLRDSEAGFRLVFSEADFLPGLIVDMFAGYVSFQTLTLGIDRWKDCLVENLRELLSPKGIYERNDAPIRELEGLGQQAGYIGQAFDPLVEMDEYGVRVLVDIQKGQKTGYFLDQGENRLELRRFVTGKEVLDAFSYSGGFGLSAARGGARKVVCVDQSQAALDLARASAERNGFSEKFVWRCANAFDVLREYERDGASFDVVVLDPPAFARSRRTVEKALAGYKEINLRAMKVLRDGGFLCTSSCSQHVLPEEFDAMLLDAARDAGKSLRVLEKRGQRADHPVLAGVPETEYLKCRICQVQAVS